MHWISACAEMTTGGVRMSAMHPYHKSSSSAKAGDPYGGEIMADGNRALDLRPPPFLNAEMTIAR